MISKQKVETLFELAKYKDIITLCVEKLYHQEEDQEFLYSYLILSLINTKEYKKAFEYTQEALIKYPSSSVYMYFCSIVELFLKEYLKAINHIKKALELEPNNASYYSHFGQIFIEVKEYEDALKILNKALTITPSDLEIQAQKALVLYMLNYERESKALIQNILQEDPHHEYALHLEQSLFTKKLKQRHSILKNLLSRNPFNKHFQNDIKFINFYYKFIPMSMIVIAILFYFSYLENISFLRHFAIFAFFIFSIIGSQDYRFNIPFIALFLGLSSYFTSIPHKFLFQDGIGVFIMSCIYHWFMFTLFHLIDTYWYLMRKHGLKGIIKLTFTYPFIRYGKLDFQAFKNYYTLFLFAMLCSLFLFYMYPNFQSSIEHLKAYLIFIFFLIATYSTKNFLVSIFYIFSTLLITQEEASKNIGIYFFLACLLTPLFFTCRRFIRKILWKKSSQIL